jgi:hypothetical protein
VLPNLKLARMKKAGAIVPAFSSMPVTQLSAAILASGRSKPTKQQIPMKTLKKLLRNPLEALSIILTVGLLAGCTTTTPQVTTAQVPYVFSQPVTNSAGVVTNTVVTNLVTVTVTNQVAAPSGTISNIVTGLNTAGTIAAAVVPGYGPSVATILGLIGTILFAGSTGVATYKNQTNKNILSAVVSGIESAAPNNQAPTTLAAVKANITKKAVAAGVAVPLNTVVQATT